MCHLLSIRCRDFADANDGAEVIGTDVSPIQPSWVPPNLELLVFSVRRTVLVFKLTGIRQMQPD